MAMKIPNSRRNLDRAIQRIFAPTDNALQIRTTMANAIIGQILPDGVVKGGSSLKLRYGNELTRFTTDLDMVRATEHDAFIEKLTLALRVGWNGFTGTVIAREPAKPKDVPTEYVMQPFDIKMSYNGSPWLTVRLEVGHDEVGDTDDPDHWISPDIVAIFEKLGFPAPAPIALMPVTHQVAQKLHGVSEPGSERVHDLIDLQLIARNEEIDYAGTKKACQRLFRARRIQGWPPIVVEGEGWDKLYADQPKKLDVLPSVVEAVAWVNQLIKDIESA